MLAATADWTPAEWLLVIGGLTTMIGTLIAAVASAVATISGNRQNAVAQGVAKLAQEQAKEAAVEAKDAAVEAKDTADKTHVLVNSKMELQLKATAAALRRVADITGKPEDVNLAENAEAASREHADRQKNIDIQER